MGFMRNKTIFKSPSLYFITLLIRLETTRDKAERSSIRSIQIFLTIYGHRLRLYVVIWNYWKKKKKRKRSITISELLKTVP